MMFRKNNSLLLSRTFLILREYRRSAAEPLIAQTSLLEEPYTVEPITRNDQWKVLEHLHNFFYLDEPLNRNVNLHQSINNNVCPVCDRLHSKFMNEGLSLMAMSTSGVVVGAALNVVDIRGEENKEADDCWDNPSYSKISDFLRALNYNADIFWKFPDVSSVMNTKIVSVDTTWRGSGIGRQLLEKTKALARRQRHQLMRMDCTGLFSAQAAVRLGYECIAKIKYCDYKADGTPIFNPERPHTEAGVYVQKLDYNY